MDIKDRLKNIINKKYKLSPEDELLLQEEIHAAITTEVNENTVALIEPHLWHSEVYPSIIKYFLDLGFSVHLFLLKENFNMKSLCRFIYNDKQLKIFQLTDMPLTQKFFDKLLKYKYIFIETLCTHQGYRFILNFEEKYLNKYCKENVYSIVHDVLSHYPTLDSPEKKFLKKHKAFVLRDGIKYNNLDVPYLAALYYGKINITHKNKNFTKFISIGGNKQGLRDFKSLMDSVDKLIEDNVNFEVVFVGVSAEKISQYITEKNKNHIKIRGTISYEKLYEEIEESDFILFNISSDSKDYKKYLKGGITGSYSLCLGFAKPGVIYKDLAEAYKLDDKGITYTKDLYQALKTAANMSNEEYQTIQQKLNFAKKELETCSLKNLEEMIYDQSNRTLCNSQ